jgi:hypothetical protein
MTLTSRCRAAVAIAAVATVLVVGCGTDEGPSSTSPTTVNDPTASRANEPMVLPTAASLNPDRTNALATILGMCEIVFTRDASTEESYSSSYRRAADLMTAELRGLLVQPPKDVRPLPQWVQWQNQNARIRGTCEESADQHPADTPTRVSRVIAVEESVTSDTGQTLSDADAAVWATATVERGRWSVARFDVNLD